MEPTDPIYQLVESPVGGLWFVHGLELLRVNETPEGVDGLLPEKCFIQTLISKEPLAVLLGGYAVRDQEDTERFRTQSIEVGMNIDFGYFGIRQQFPGVFLPEVSSEFLASYLLERYYLEHQAMLIFSGGDTTQITQTLDTPGDHIETLRRLSQLSKWVIQPGHDAQHPQIWTVYLKAEEELIRSCDAADRAVKELPWFQHARPYLQPSGGEHCYMLNDPRSRTNS